VQHMERWRWREEGKPWLSGDGADPTTSGEEAIEERRGEVIAQIKPPQVLFIVVA
jgi:hypothetical protein